jgi:hypothetical protein
MEPGAVELADAKAAETASRSGLMVQLALSPSAAAEAKEERHPGSAGTFERLFGRFGAE